MALLITYCVTFGGVRTMPVVALACHLYGRPSFFLSAFETVEEDALASSSEVFADETAVVEGGIVSDSAFADDAGVAEDDDKAAEEDDADEEAFEMHGTCIVGGPIDVDEGERDERVTVSS
jgi:hypothetical protein